MKKQTPLIDQFQRRLSHVPLQWFPVSPEVPLLWTAFIGDVEWPKGFWVYHPQTTYLDVEQVLEGNLILHKDNEKYLLNPGDIAIIPPGEHKLAVGNKGFCKKRHLGIKGMIFNNNLSNLHLDQIQIIEQFSNSEFETVYTRLKELTILKDENSVREYASLSYQMLLLLSHQIKQNPYPVELQKAISFIQRDFARIHVLADICEYVSCSKSTLQWQFKHYLKSSPITFLTEVRMKYARRLLENTELSIKEITERCGYSDQLYFSAVFRKHCSASPRDHRKYGSHSLQNKI